MSTLAEKVTYAISEAIDTDELILPTMPEMALRVREVAQNPNSSVQQLAAVIGSDAALTARLIKIANSALYRGAAEIQSLQMALARLGMATTSTLATGLAMEQMFQATTDMVDRRLRQAWTQSSEIAGACTVLCKHYTRLRPDQAALAGLVHKIGVLPILSFAENYPGLLKDSITLDAIIQDIHTDIGRRILIAWDFPKEIQNIPVAHLDFQRQTPTADYADLVTVALLETYPAQFKDLNYNAVTAFGRLGINPQTENINGEKLRDVVNNASGMLKLK